jgi:hypothetical protein
MNKFELQDKIKEKWVTRGIISMIPVFFLAGFLSNVLIGLILVLITLAICFSMYKSELASALMWNTNKKKRKR